MLKLVIELKSNRNITFNGKDAEEASSSINQIGDLVFFGNRFVTSIDNLSCSFSYDDSETEEVECD